jgi:hypothetical protein
MGFTFGQNDARNFERSDCAERSIEPGAFRTIGRHRRARIEQRDVRVLGARYDLDRRLVGQACGKRFSNERIFSENENPERLP